jgi:O-6-methylguanine DNA methyltransferase
MGEVFATREFVSPIGVLRCAVGRGGVIRIALPRDGGDGFVGWLARRLPDAERVDWLPELDDLERELTEYFDGRLTRFGVPLDLRGTPFQVSVWRALLEIPYGETCSYAAIADQIGRPRAQRAVGAANGANPVPVLVPCHRVIASGGGLGGYGGGLDAKRRLLAFERAAVPRGSLL